MGAYQFDQYDTDERARKMSRGRGFDVKIQMQEQLEILKNTRAAIYAGVYIATAGEWAKIGETQSVLRRLNPHNDHEFEYAGRKGWKIQAWLPIPYDPVCPDTSVVRPFGTNDGARAERRAVESQFHRQFEYRRIDYEGARELFDVTLKDFWKAAVRIEPEMPVMEIRVGQVFAHPANWKARRNAKMLQAIIREGGLA